MKGVGSPGTWRISEATRTVIAGCLSSKSGKTTKAKFLRPERKKKEGQKGDLESRNLEKGLRFNH